MNTRSLFTKLTFVIVTLFTLSVSQVGWGQNAPRSNYDVDATDKARKEGLCLDDKKRLDEAHLKLTEACAKAGLHEWSKCAERVELCRGVAEEEPTERGALFFQNASEDQTKYCADIDKKEKEEKVKDLEKDLKEKKKEIDTKNKELNEKRKDAKKDTSQLQKELADLEKENQKRTRETSEDERKAAVERIKNERDLVRQVNNLNLDILKYQAEINIELSNKAGALAELTPYLVEKQCLMEIKSQMNQKGAEKLMAKSSGGLIRASGDMAMFKENLIDACYNKMMSKRAAVTKAAEAKMAALNQQIVSTNQELQTANKELSTIKTQVAEQQQEAQQKKQQDQINYFNDKMRIMNELQSANQDMTKEQNQNNMGIVNDSMELQMKSNELTNIKQIPAGRSSIGQVIELGATFDGVKTSICTNWNKVTCGKEPNNCSTEFTKYNESGSGGGSKGPGKPSN